MLRSIVFLASFLFLTNLSAQNTFKLEANYTYAFYQNEFSGDVSRVGIMLNNGITKRFSFSIGLNYSHMTETFLQRFYYNYLGFAIDFRYAIIKKEKDRLLSVVGVNYNMLKSFSEDALYKAYGDSYKFNIPKLNPEFNFSLKYEHDFTKQWGIGISPTLYTYLFETSRGKLFFVGASFSVLYTL